MPSSSTQQRASARRALIADISADRKGWLQHGIAALGVSLLGLGVAASVSLTGAAQDTTAHPVARPRVESSVAAENDSTPNPRLAAKGSADSSAGNKLKSLADQRAEELAEASEDYAIAASTTSAEKRDKALKNQAKEARRSGEAAGRAGNRVDSGGGLPELDASAIQGDGKACLPLAVLPHRGPLRPDRDLVALPHRHRLLRPHRHPAPGPAAGVVINAGIGPASGWAGNYVAIQYPDGTYTLHGTHVDRVRPRRPDRLGLSARRRHRHDRTHLRSAPALRGLPDRQPGSDLYQAVNPPVLAERSRASTRSVRLVVPVSGRSVATIRPRRLQSRLVVAAVIPPTVGWAWRPRASRPGRRCRGWDPAAGADLAPGLRASRSGRSGGRGV